MISYVMKIEGLEKLQRKLEHNTKLEEVKRCVRLNGSELNDLMQKNADFKKGYQTGTTKRSINLSIKDNGFTAESGPTTEYSEYLERGTRYMEAQPFVRPSFDVQKEIFKKDIEKLMR